jgi:maltokinase
VDVIGRLSRAWPPDEPIGAYGQELSLAGSCLIDAVALPATPGDPHEGARALAVAEHPQGHLVAAPVCEIEGVWRKAFPGDGAASALVDALMSHTLPSSRFRVTVHPGALPASSQRWERPIPGDQTNESVVVGDSIVVKWVRRPSREGHPAPLLLAHLSEVGFTGVPTPHGTLVWEPPSGGEVVLALLDAYLPEALDGWDWCVDDVLEHLPHAQSQCPATCRADFPAALGALVADLHAALATPSSVLPEPVTQADRSAVLGWLDDARAGLAAALDCTPDPERAELDAMAPSLAGVLGQLTGVTSTPVLRIHGDLHVGQVLRWPGGLALIDFDGNPTLPESVVTAPAPAARDVAQMLSALDHVGRVANRRTDGAHAEAVELWIQHARDLFLAAYRKGLADAGLADLLDERLLAPFEVEQECRELVYATRFLPRWRYAPMGALRAYVANLPPSETI